MKKILLLNHYAGSPEMGMEFRPYYLAREWVKLGYSVRIVAGDYSHLRIKNHRARKDFEEETIDGIQYVWLRTGDYKGNGVRRALTMFRFVGKLWLKAGWIAKEWKPDVVIASSTYPLDTYAAQKIAKKAGARLIHEVHDMWPATLYEMGGMSKHHPFVILMQMAEDSFCKHSDYVVSLLVNAKDYFIRHGMKPEKFRAIVNGVVKEEWEKEMPVPEAYAGVLRKLKEQGKFIICFFGTHTKFYGLFPLIEAVQNLDSDRITVVFIGNGWEKKELEKEAKEKHGERFVFLPQVEKTAIPGLLKMTDVLYVGAVQNRLYRFGVCMNKIFDSMMAGKPILYAVAAPNNYIEEYRCGVSVEAGNVEALSAGIMQLYTMSEGKRKKLGSNGRNAVINYFTYEKLAKKFEELF